ncbi:hypothetical protein [Winogradskyella endarachnes]|uniref:Uncharacterized protein n=1 Tax=Winogradskyella endarachnes TaxID=2681965 RepID=A0A6L6UA60_9FLAO|nr:hypothetical protein [Winogradskyella endarachnes]MUU77807.1 hypothetical protein [Winogradskyella endarachnes]
MFKNVFLCFTLLVATFGYSQSQNNETLTKPSQTIITNVDIVVEVDSAADIEKTFKVEDIKKIIESSEKNETITFKIVCQGNQDSAEKDSKMTYKVEGNTNYPNEFLNLITNVRASAIKFYNNKI